MTGYGRYRVDRAGRTLLVELKSVNHRFLDLSIKIPRAHNYAESALRKEISSRIKRGHIDVYVTYTDTRKNKIEIKVDESLAEAYAQAAKMLSDTLIIENDYTVACLMKAPDVISENPIEDDESVILEMYKECINGSIDELEKMRIAEGAELMKDLLNRALTIKSELDGIEKRVPKALNEYRDKLSIRIREALKDTTIDEARLINEVAFYSDKCAIDEEITRLNSHIKSFISLIESKEPNGKKIDFLVQEMNRESNTINSKANDIEIINRALLMKAEIEKIREQIQNIE